MRFNGNIAKPNLIPFYFLPKTKKIKISKIFTTFPLQCAHIHALPVDIKVINKTNCN